MTAIRSVSTRAATSAALLLAVGLAAGCGALGGADREEAGGGQSASGSEIEEEPTGDEPADDGVDGDISVDTDGGTVTHGDDDEGLSVTVGADALPEWFPAELPLPAEFTVLSATESQSDDGRTLGAMITAPADFEDVVELLDEGFAAAGIEVTDRDVSEVAGMRTGTYFLILDGTEWGSSSETSARTRGRTQSA